MSLKVINFMFVYFLYTFFTLISLSYRTMADNKTNNRTDIKAMITSGYRMYSSIYAQHVVSIRVLEEIKYQGDNHFCGGTIIAPKKILTAAHCLKTIFGEVPAKEITVWGATLFRLSHTGQEKIFKVTDVIFHPNFTSEGFADIGYLILSKPVEEEKDVISIAPLVQQTPVVGTQCTALGWGSIFSNGPLADEILYVDLYIWDRKDCLKVQKDMRDKIFCAGNHLDRGRGTCSGDSGGPLFCNGEVAGIVSYGAGCGWTDISADFYTDVASYRDWINYGVKLEAYEMFLLFLCIATIFIK